MDLHWGQNITKRLEDPDSLLQPCEMLRRAVLFFCAEHLNPLFQTSGTRRGDLHLKEKKKKAKCERIFLPFKVQHSSSQHGAEKKKSWNQIHLIVIVKGTLSLMLSHNPLHQISVKRVRVCDKTVSQPKLTTHVTKQQSACTCRTGWMGVNRGEWSFHVFLFLPKMCFGLYSRSVYLYFVRWMTSWDVYMLCTWAMSCIYTIKLKRNPSYPGYERDCEYDLTWEFWINELLYVITDSPLSTAVDSIMGFI